MGNGEQNFYCQQLSQCNACYIVENVTVYDEAIQTCYALSVTCTSIVTITEHFDFGCANTTSCSTGNIE